MIEIKIHIFILYGVFGYLLGLLTGHFFTKGWYVRIVNNMTTKNQQLIDRVKKAESIILNDVLQLSPDDINLLKEKMKENKQEGK